MKKRVLTLAIGLMLTAGLLTGCGNKKAEPEAAKTEESAETETTGDKASEDKAADETEAAAQDGAAAENAAADDTAQAAVSEEPLTGKHHVEIEIENYGTIALELDADIAPISTTNFVKLAKEGFYDGLTFHRIISGFMIQGGDPVGNGTGGSGQNIKGEFAKNGVENTISHTRGVISMARSGQPDSASSQFFIVHEDSTFLDGEYAAFGNVTEGMEIVDQISADTAVEDGNGTVLPENQPKITKITVID